jgi:hypothetical protein
MNGASSYLNSIAGSYLGTPALLGFSVYHYLSVVNQQVSLRSRSNQTASL